MKKILLICLCLVFYLRSFSQTVDWVKAESYPSWVQWTNIVVHDVLGNTYISSKVDLTTDGIFIGKYDNQGNIIWSKYYSGWGIVAGMCTDNSGNLYTFMFAPNVEGVNYNSNNGGLFAKYDINGNLIWIKQIKLNARFSERTDANNNIILTGVVTDTVNLENGITLTSPPGGHRLFIARFNTNGECIWAIQDDGGMDPLICNINGDMCVSSGLYQTTTLGKGANQITLNAGNYMAKYAPNGDLDWAKQTTGAGSALIALDEYGNAYTIKQGKVTKYDTAGNLLWNRTQISVNAMYKAQMKCGNNGDLFISGGFANYMSIGDTTIYGDNHYHAFVAKLDSAGKLKWVITSKGTGSAGAKDITVLGGDEIYITGDMSGANSFGSNTVNQPQGGVFVAKITDNDITEITAPTKTDDVFTVYPNPTGNIFYIIYTTSESVSNLRLEIKNAAGQTIYTKQYKSFDRELKASIDLGKQAKGIYFLEMLADRKRTVRKIVLE